MTFQQSSIFLLVEFPANAMDCAHTTTRYPPSTRHRYSIASSTNGAVSVVESADWSTIYKSGSFLCSRKCDFVRKKITFSQSRSSFPTAKTKHTSICSSLWTCLGMAPRDLKLAALEQFHTVYSWPGKLTTPLKLEAVWKGFLSTSATNLASCSGVEIFHLPLQAFRPKIPERE